LGICFFVPNRSLQFQKRSQLFIRPHNETLSFTAMRVCNPDRLPVGTTPALTYQHAV
jgi:hypothetical protein